jgi:hypothetical protein
MICAVHFGKELRSDILCLSETHRDKNFVRNETPVGSRPQVSDVVDVYKIQSD